MICCSFVLLRSSDKLNFVFRTVFCYESFYYYIQIIFNNEGHILNQILIRRVFAVLF
jgi:hypothetical protein